METGTGADWGRRGNLYTAALFTVKKVSVVDGGGTGVCHWPLRRLPLPLSNCTASVSRSDGKRLLSAS